MIRLRIAALVLLGSLVASAAGASGIELRWNACSSPITNNNVEPWSAAQHDLVVTLTGYELDASEIDLTILVFDPCSSDGQFIPQAWRFDAGGCQAGRLAIDRPASFDGCDGLVPLAGIALESVTADELHTTIGQHNDPVTYPSIFIHIAQGFTLRHLAASDRYVVARIRLDMSNTVAGADPAGLACGCGSAARQITVLNASLGGPEGTVPIQGTGSVEERAFWADYDYCVIDKPGPPTTNWGADPACLTTASRASSWGAIKAQYR